MTPASKTITHEEAFGPLVRQHFAFFLEYAFLELSGGRQYHHNWHIEAIEHQLDRVRLGQNNRLIVTMPPRHLKSITISIAWVAWMLGRDPSLRFTCVSYGMQLAEKHARDCLQLMSSDWYRRAFPEVRITKRAVLDFETSAGGGRLSTSIGGALTGRGGDMVIIDDPMKTDDINSEAHRAEVIRWFWETLRSRLDDQVRGAIIVVQQRLHEGDLAGELIRAGGWYELKLPAIATHDELVPLTNGRFHQRREGCALHPARMPLAQLYQKRRENAHVFAAQDQQDPISRIGAFVQPEWFGTYDEAPHTGVVVQSWDTAIKQTVRSDWSVGITAIYYMRRFFVIDVYRKRVPYTELKRSIEELCRQHRVDRLLIEDASSGQALIEQFGQERPDGVPLPLPIHPTSDKVTRFEAQASRIEAGMVVLPRTAPWLAEFITELCKFPNGRHDDQADALAQMLANPPIHIPRTPCDGPEIIDPSLTDWTTLPPGFDPW